MEQDTKNEINAKAAEAIVAEAQAVAKNLIDTATRTASRMTENSDSKTREILTEALKDAFGEHENSGRFIDTARIPLICQDLKGIHGNLESIQDNLKWIVRLIIGAVVLALLGLVLTR